MATRLIVDDSFADTIRYYETFPTEPINDGAGLLDVKLPIEKDDRLKGPTLLKLMNRLAALPAGEKIVIISCHGTTKGLAITLGSTGDDKMLASAQNLHILFILAITRIRIQDIKRLPADQQADAWDRAFKDMKYLDGKPMLLSMPGESASRYEKVFNWFFKALAGSPDPFPAADDVQTITPPPGSATIKATFTLSFKKAGPTASLSSSASAADVQRALECLKSIGTGNIQVTGPNGGPWTCVFVNALGGKPQELIEIHGGGSVKQKDRVEFKPADVKAIINSAAELDQLVTLRNQIFGRFDRLEFRACNTGRNKDALQAMKHYFGCKIVTAPDVVSFDIIMRVLIDSGFDKNLNNHIDTATTRALATGPAVRLARNQKGQEVQTAVARGDIPQTRRFDSDKTRPGDEVFIRLWPTNIHPHRFFGWLRAISDANVTKFVQDRISKDTSRWVNTKALPLSGLWLVDDFNVLLPTPPTLVAGPTAGNPLDGLGLGAPPPSALPTFALARDPEYVKHLISSL
jgi:hypothetical protein